MKQFESNPNYPMNLVTWLVGYQDPEDPNSIKFPEPEILIPSVEYVLHTLEEKEMDIIHYKFLYNLSAHEIAKILHVSDQRIYQRVQSIRHKLMNPKRYGYIRYGVEGVIQKEIKEAKESIDKYIKENNIDPDEVDKEKIKYEMLLDKEVEELNLSTRAFTVVKRSKYNTIRDLVKSYKLGSIQDMRQCGPKTLQEIYDKLVIFGVPEKELQYDEQTDKIEQAIIDEMRKQESERKIQTARQREKELQILREGIISVHDAIIKNGSKSLEMLFSDSILLNLQEHIKSFFPNERVVGLLLKTELYDPESDRSPYKDFVKREGFRKALRYFKAEGTNLTYGDTQWIRFLYRNLEDISENEGEDSESGKFHFVPSI